MRKVIGMIPGLGGMMDALGDVDPEQDMKRMFGIIDSMTAEERRHPGKVIDQSRRRRIAVGAGVEPHEITELVKMFEPMAQMMRDMAGKSMRERAKMVQQFQRDAITNPDGALSKKKKGTGKRLSNQEKTKLKKDREKELRRRRRAERQGKS
jgi:signal recognition particle subunit SRP54